MICFIIKMNDNNQMCLTGVVCFFVGLFVGFLVGAFVCGS
jgi:hypothetical protein